MRPLDRLEKQHPKRHTTLPYGNGFHPHLDAPAYGHIGCIEHITANIAIDTATIAIRCLEVVPGSHKMDVDLANGSRIADSWVQSHTWVAIPLAPGDILIFGCHIAHRSAPNETSE
ncbi:hypothetical protein SPBR_09108 [Sporothrix brasiliensis 5110]|uniref:Phytanoyl-CoA dioxygenase n=1 Tax=Sporothrix brasiliensis 5110 TaxID=1398154 RepID=A0A0C2J2J8_9PEZI|nr:uncharacterized protein SPBR_09108 [Sporothrix brasiliensis 5110]KIH93265.1 hypothetical protein SPBR_09108 [Sporothrix brasiliensis 5110]